MPQASDLAPPPAGGSTPITVRPAAGALLARQRSSRSRVHSAPSRSATNSPSSSCRPRRVPPCSRSIAATNDGARLIRLSNVRPRVTTTPAAGAASACSHFSGRGVVVSTCRGRRPARSARPRLASASSAASHLAISSPHAKWKFGPRSEFGLGRAEQRRGRPVRPRQAAQRRLEPRRRARHAHDPGVAFDHDAARLAERRRDQRDLRPRHRARALVDPRRAGEGLAEAAPGEDQPCRPVARRRHLPAVGAKIGSGQQRLEFGGRQVGDDRRLRGGVEIGKHLQRRAEIVGQRRLLVYRAKPGNQSMVCGGSASRSGGRSAVRVRARIAARNCSRVIVRTGVGAAAAVSRSSRSSCTPSRLS